MGSFDPPTSDQTFPDWPHVRWRKTMMNDAKEVELFYRSIDNDPALMRKILVDNPARLHGF